MATDLETLWANKSDEDVDEAVAELPTFSDQAVTAILAEADRRGLSPPGAESVPKEAAVIVDRVWERPSGLPRYLSTILAFSAFGVYLLSRESLLERPVILLLIFGLGAAASLLRTWHRQRTQEYLNKVAVALPAEPTAAPFWLYLRPFQLDGSLPVKNPAAGGFSGLFGFVSHFREFEELLREAVGRKGQLALVGLTGREKHTGAGRLEVADSEWQETLEGLARSARYFIVVPGRGSVLWEVEFLVAHEMLERTVFLMPPAPDTTAMLRGEIGSHLTKMDIKSVSESFLGTAPKSEGPHERWDEAAREMRSLGLEVPDYRKGGMLFTFDRNGAPKDQGVLRTNRPRVLRKGLKWLTGDSLL